MKVRMLRDERGCDDGVHAVDHAAGEVYDLGKFLGDLYVREGAAEAVDAREAPHVAPEPVEPVSAPKNTALDGPDRRKPSTPAKPRTRKARKS